MVALRPVGQTGCRTLRTMRNERLSDADVEAALLELPGWKHADDRITAEFSFESFVVAFGFMTEVAFHAERLDHHPEWRNVYNQVAIELTTHDSGGLTALDIELAQCVNRLAAAR